MTSIASHTFLHPATAEDFAALADMAHALALHHGDTYTPAADVLQRDYGAWYRAVLVLSAQRQPIGFAVWLPLYLAHMGVRLFEIQTLFVRQTYRSQGIGEQLVAHVAAVAIDAGCGAVRISVRKNNARAVSFYQRLGCRLIDRGEQWACRLEGDALKTLARRARTHPGQ